MRIKYNIAYRLNTGLTEFQIWITIICQIFESFYLILRGSRNEFL